MSPLSRVTGLPRTSAVPPRARQIQGITSANRKLDVVAKKSPSLEIPVNTHYFRAYGEQNSSFAPVGQTCDITTPTMSQ